MESGFSWQEALTLGIAALGAFLGVMNTWQAINRDRVRLRVRPLSVMAIATGDQGYGIEVVNLSSFPVTVEEVGFTLNARSATRGERLVVLVPINSDGGPWPRRLEPRTTVKIGRASCRERVCQDV